MMTTYHTRRRVEFRQTDAAGIIHFSAFFDFMESVEHEFLRSRGLSVMMPHGDATISWPRVSVRCDFHEMVRFEDELDVDLTLVRLGDKSATYGFTFTHQGRDIASGQVTSVCCRIAPGEPPRSIAIPDDIRQQLQGGSASNPPAP